MKMVTKLYHAMCLRGGKGYGKIWKGSATALPREQRSISAEWWQSNSERTIQAAMADPLGR